jgi:hypothetical protein
MLIDLENLIRVADDLTREYLGVVVDNNDPKKLGRVKVTIDGLLEGSASDLPFVQSKMNPDFFMVPEVGDKLRITFRDGDIYMPEYSGYYHTTETHNSEFDTDYPNSLGIERSGFKIKYNKQSELFEIQTPNGSFMQINKDGDVKFESKKDFIVNSDGKITFQSAGNVEIKSDGTATFSGTGGTTLGDSASVTNVNGSQVLLAGGGLPVALLNSMSLGIGNEGRPVISNVIAQVSTKVKAAP